MKLAGKQLADERPRRVGCAERLVPAYAPAVRLRRSICTRRLSALSTRTRNPSI